jgi:hypothetical protein
MLQGGIMKKAVLIVALLAALLASVASARRPSGAIARNIAAANQLRSEQCGHVHGYCDPWPSCPDPFDGRGSWQDTKNCESRGSSWEVDPPGYFCGPLQIDPKIWPHIIRKYAIPC